MLVAIFAVVSTAALAYAGPAFLSANSDDVLGAMSTLVLGSTAGKLLDPLRVDVGDRVDPDDDHADRPRDARYGCPPRAAPSTFARMHPRYLTPTVATLAMGAISAVFFVLLTALSKNVLADSASSVGLLIAFYDGLTGFACAWFFRRELLRSPRNLLFKGILPTVGGLVLLGAFILSIKSYIPASSSYPSFDGIGGIFLIGAGSLALGAILMLVVRWRMPAFFTEGTLPPLTPPTDTGEASHLPSAAPQLPLLPAGIEVDCSGA